MNRGEKAIKRDQRETGIERAKRIVAESAYAIGDLVRHADFALPH